MIKIELIIMFTLIAWTKKFSFFFALWKFEERKMPKNRVFKEDKDVEFDLIFLIMQKNGLNDSK